MQHGPKWMRIRGETGLRVGLTLLPSHLNLLPSLQKHVVFSAERHLHVVQERHMLAAEMPVRSFHTIGGVPSDGNQLTGIGHVVGAGALEVSHSPTEG